MGRALVLGLLLLAACGGGDRRPIGDAGPGARDAVSGDAELVDAGPPCAPGCGSLEACCETPSGAMCVRLSDNLDHCGACNTRCDGTCSLGMCR